ncbi:hypothetical protein EV127DRAFT_26674 [Xylaria flabelliformis]|nr:hypothetical protein EV127DRAFT_26674 [Xylaria flabelliformis]KAI0864246.1 hypothetical protein F4860DRAFT_436531 [Xylaria cubensis]
MDSLPVELLRLIYSYCDFESVPNLRAVSPKLADVGYEYLLSPNFTSLNWRLDIDRLHNIALHERLRGSIQSINIFLGELSYYDAWSTSWAQHFVAPPEERAELMAQARVEFDRIAKGRKKVGPLHLRADDLREACSALPNLRDLEVSFAQCPSTLNNKFIQEAFFWPNCRKLDRQETYQNLDAVMFALHGIKLSSFKVDRLPLEIFRLKNHRLHWFTHAQSFNSLSSLNLTLDPSGLRGPTSAFRAVNGLGRILQLATNVTHLKLAFHPYSSEHSRFALTFGELFFDFTYTRLTDLVLEGVSCDEEDLKEFLGRHGTTLVRLRLGGRGLAKPFEASHGGIHLYEGTFRSLFTGLRMKLPKLERMHLEGIFDCEHQDLPSHETYNFYPLTDENWQDVPTPKWVRSSRKTISCLPFEQYVLNGGVYPGGSVLTREDE